MDKVKLFNQNMSRFSAWQTERKKKSSAIGGESISQASSPTARASVAEQVRDALCTRQSALRVSRLCRPNRGRPTTTGKIHGTKRKKIKKVQVGSIILDQRNKGQERTLSERDGEIEADDGDKRHRRE